MFWKTVSILLEMKNFFLIIWGFRSIIINASSTPSVEANNSDKWCYLQTDATSGVNSGYLKYMCPFMAIIGPWMIYCICASGALSNQLGTVGYIHGWVVLRKKTYYKRFFWLSCLVLTVIWVAGTAAMGFGSQGQLNGVQGIFTGTLASFFGLFGMYTVNKEYVGFTEEGAKIVYPIPFKVGTFSNVDTSLELLQDCVTAFSVCGDASVFEQFGTSEEDAKTITKNLVRINDDDKAESTTDKAATV